MAICTNPKVFSDLVEEFITEYEKSAKDSTLDDTESTPISETLERLYAYRAAIKAGDDGYIRAQGIKINDLKEALKGGDLENIKTKKDALNEVAQALASKAYQQAQAEQEAAQGANGQAQDDINQDDSVVDAEFEEVD